jgi:hypothetical protein
MRWLAAATLVFTTLAWHAPAQRAGAAHAGGGFGARGAPSAPSFRGGFSGGSVGARSFASPGAMSYRSAPGYRGPVARGYAPGVRMAPSRAYAARSPYAAYGSRPAYRSTAPGATRSIRRPYPPNPGPRYRNGRFEGTYVAAYPYASSAWLTPWELGYPDDYDYGYNPSAYSPSDAIGQDVDPPYLGAPQEVDEEQAAYDQGRYPDSARTTAQLEPEDGLTLIFRDGRPPQQIHNYMLTKTTLTVVDGRRLREVPVADLDVSATEAANRNAGVVFALPQ